MNVLEQEYSEEFDKLRKEITMTDIMHSLESDYGIDWSKLEVHIEGEKHWVTGARKGVR